jgi:hypothetical protein
MQKRGSVGILVVSAAITLVLPHLPVVSLLVRPLVWLSTFAHEMGHGIAAELVGGRFISFVMHGDGSGVALTASSGRLQRAAICAGGLVGPALSSMLFFFLARRDRWARIGLGILAGAYLLALLLVVRNVFGIVFVSALVLCMAAVVKWGNALAAQFTLVFLAVNLAVSVFTRGDYLFTEVAQTAVGSGPSDVANMAKALFLPYWFWGALCGAVSLLALALGLWSYLRSAPAGKPPQPSS